MFAVVPLTLMALALTGCVVMCAALLMISIAERRTRTRSVERRDSMAVGAPSPSGGSARP